MPTSTDLGTYAQAATIGSNRQEYTVSTFWLRCSHARYAVNTIEIRLIHDVQSRNSRFRYVLHTLIQDPKPITTDTMTMYLRWRRPWYDLGRFSYAHADQLTFWIRLWRADRRYLSRPHKHIRRPLPIPSSCPSTPWIQYTVPCFWFIFWNSMSISSNSRFATGLAEKKSPTFPWNFPDCKQIPVTVAIYTLWWFLRYIQNHKEITLFINRCFKIVVLKIGQHKRTFSISWKLSPNIMQNMKQSLEKIIWQMIFEWEPNSRFCPSSNIIRQTMKHMHR